MTEFYDEYIGAYEEPPVPPMRMPEGVAAWAARARGAPPPPSAPTTRGYEERSRAGNDDRSRIGYDERSRSGYDERSRSGFDERSRAAPSSYGGNAGLRRKLSRRPTRYEEEEEGYVSGEYSDQQFELVKIRVKASHIFWYFLSLNLIALLVLQLHYKDDVRGMAISPGMQFEEFLEKVSSKFGRAFGTLGLKFKDEDGGKVSMRDDSDYDLAIETARESAKGRPEGKLEVWCTDE